MNKEFIEKIENKAKSINILDNDPFVKESCKNLYRALLVVAENENPPINNISNILSDPNKTIELLTKFDSINKEKYNGDLSYVVIDINNNQTLLYLIELLKQSINYSGELDNTSNHEENTNNKKEIDLDNINTILTSIFSTSTFLNINNIKDIKFLPSKQGYTIEVSDSNKKLYMGISEYGYVEVVRENSIDGKIVYMSNDDTINNNNTNSSINKIKSFFHIDSKNNKDVIKFAQDHGYKGAKYIGNWKEYKVYEPYIDNKQVSYIGLPLVILVNNNGEIRMSTSDEAMATLDDKSFIESFEETQNNNKTDSNVVSEVVSNIDEQIRKLESHTDSNFTNNPSINENEINQQIEKNLIEVRNYSILNKTEEELYLAKKRFIKDWYNLLTNQLDEHWTMNSSTYRVHIQSIAEAILRRTDDEISRKELEYLQQASECILNKNRVILIKIVVDMSTLEDKIR